MKNKLAKLLRAWAERLDPGHTLVKVNDGVTSIQTAKRVLTLQKLKAEKFLTNTYDAREREYLELVMRAEFSKTVEKMITIEEDVDYGQARLTATLYYYA